MNFYDYIIWRGDITFDKSPFNIVDNLLFSYAAYTDLRGVIKEGEAMTIHDAAEKFFETHTEEECLKSGSLIAHSPVVLRRMGESARFGNLLITDYVRDINEEETQQFSAMHFNIDKRHAYVAFCGTDDTIVGWKEDFQMSYKTVKSQILSAEYLNKTANKAFHTYIVGGHSKGGNLAVYGAMKANAPVQKKILRIYSNDGPGISDIAMDSKKFNQISNRMIKVLPEFSVFGMLFDNHEPKIVIKSGMNGLYEHDAVGWQVRGTDFERGQLSDDCMVIQEVLNEFLQTMTIKEREELVNEMYSVFVKAGIENTTDFTQKGMPLVLKFLKEATNLNENAREGVEKLLQVLGKNISEKAEDAVKKKVRDVTEKLPDFIKNPIHKKLEESEEKDAE